MRHQQQSLTLRLNRLDRSRADGCLKSLLVFLRKNEMSIHHSRPGEIVDVSALGPLLPSTTSHALFKSADLEVIRSVMRAGETMPSHAVAGESTVQCIEGKVQLTCATGVQELSRGQLVYLGRQETHTIFCSEDASLLRTICLLPDIHNGVKTSSQTSL
jgi:quercetin dioxygenase-like cupin family protein